MHPLYFETNVDSEKTVSSRISYTYIPSKKKQEGYFCKQYDIPAKYTIPVTGVKS
jgi:hypothetical protein